ncbi:MULTISPECIES: hypothetical protein [Kamptonema]|uniref:hypothetical protein n=1 Tax=Kamptonema TaxID=1501433 RepID=UPI00031EF8E7|nr:MULTISPECIES: hypothetical protein [Kamptonema]
MFYGSAYTPSDKKPEDIYVTPSLYRIYHQINDPQTHLSCGAKFKRSLVPPNSSLKATQASIAIPAII